MVILCLAVIAFGVVYYLDPPMPNYYPVVNRWEFEADLKGPSMGWYGRSAAGLGAAGIVTWLLSVTLTKTGREPMDKTAGGIPVWLAYGMSVLTAAVLIALMVGIVLHALHEWGLWGNGDGEFNTQRLEQ